MAEEARTKRLCTEIQLFDLCSKEVCSKKDGRFCTDSELLSEFEAISEEDVMRDQFIDDSDDNEDDADLEYGDGCFDDVDEEDGDWDGQ